MRSGRLVASRLSWNVLCVNTTYLSSIQVFKRAGNTTAGLRAASAVSNEKQVDRIFFVSNNFLREIPAQLHRTDQTACWSIGTPNVYTI